jgi:hypothetical protein
VGKGIMEREEKLSNISDLGLAKGVKTRVIIGDLKLAKIK